MSTQPCNGRAGGAYPSHASPAWPQAHINGRDARTPGEKRRVSVRFDPDRPEAGAAKLWQLFPFRVVGRIVDDRAVRARIGLAVVGEALDQA